MGFLTASRLNKMKNSFREGDYEKAVIYADKLNPSEIRTTYDLSMMSDVYMQTNRLGASKRVLTEMYKRNKSIRVCKQLVELNIKLKNIKQAIRYVKEIHQFDPEDYDRFIYQYQIGKMLNQSDEYLIECLKKVKESDYIDKWALEIAKLFYKAGYISECEKECQNIKLWFPDTEYAVKADMLLSACKAGVSYEQSVGTKDEAALTEEYFEEEYESDEIGEEYFGEEISEEKLSDTDYSEEGYAEEEFFEADYSEDEGSDEEEFEFEYAVDDNANIDEEFTLELSEDVFEESGDEASEDEGIDELYEFSGEETLEAVTEEVAVTLMSEEPEEAFEEAEEAIKNTFEEAPEEEFEEEVAAAEEELFEDADEDYFGEGGYEFEEDEDEPEYTEDGFEAIDFSAINYEELRRKSDIDRIIADEEQKANAFDSKVESEESPESEDDFDNYSMRMGGGMPSMTEISSEEDVFFNISDSVKSIMDNDEPEPEEEDIATTLVNDSLTNEVMSALLEQERRGFGGEDAVDESIRKMLEE